LSAPGPSGGLLLRPFAAAPESLEPARTAPATWVHAWRRARSRRAFSGPRVFEPRQDGGAVENASLDRLRGAAAAGVARSPARTPW